MVGVLFMKNKFDILKIFLMIILLIAIVWIGIYVFVQRQKLNELTNVIIDSNVEKSKMSGVYELGINLDNYDVNTGGIIKNYSEYQNIKTQYKIKDFENESMLQDNFNNNDYIYYILEIDNCKEVIDDYNIDVIDKKANLTFYVESKYGVCNEEAILYLIPVNKDSIDEVVNIDYEYIIDDNEMIISVEKPILYLYPEEKMKVKVQLKNSNNIISSYPKYGNGWEVVANSNGDLYDGDGKYYYALYWDEVNVTSVDFKEGFYVTKDNAISFLEEKLAIIGLNEREKNEFIMYWLPKLEKNEKNLVYFELTEEREKNNKLIVMPVPDSVLRVNIHIKKVDDETEIVEQELKSFKRIGFSVVEWGGTVH